MSIDADEEILQDFLIEAGEILELLSEQLVSLENDPTDMDLLNAIFRGFHTVKGGAGFLNLTAMVEVCHITENIFDILRNGARIADSPLMDAVLQALDHVNIMFDEVKGGDEPSSAPQELLETLESFAQAEGSSAPVKAIPPVEEVAAEPEPKAASADEISDDEFESLLDEIHGAKSSEPKKEAAAEPATSDDISDDEFEALLDEIHGGSKSKPSVKETKPAANADEISDDEFEALLDELHGNGSVSAKTDKAKTEKVKTGSDDSISDDEFESLLDELHGAGQKPSVTTTSSTPAKPAPKSTPPTPIAAKPTPSKPVPATPKPEPKAAPAKPVEKPKAPVKSTAVAPESTVRVDTSRLDEIMNMVGELVLARNRLKMLGQNYQDEDLNKAVATLDSVTSDLQGSVMKTRMQPIKKVFGRFPRVVRDLARSLKKEITLQLVGEETDLDKNLVEALADPLVHLVRNSVDHGIESPEVRASSGKPRTGKVVLSAAQEGDHILLAIEDDGKGMDPNALRRKAVEKGLMDQDQADRLNDTEAFNLIFMAGFSTKEEISDVSGRGVGMDVVKTKITQLNGSLAIDSQLGRGTKILIKVPLTLAILPTLMVTLGKQAFALPLASVNEIFHLDLRRTNIVDGQEMVVVREKALPLFYLDRWLLPPGHATSLNSEEGHVVIVQVGTHKVGFVVDSLLGQEEVVIKPLGRSLQGTPGMAGATITSDGGIALILDVPSLLKKYAKRS